MKKQDLLLIMIAISGELPVRLAGRVVSSDSYAAALITSLKQREYISVRKGGGCRGYVLRTKGKRYLLENYQADTAFFLEGASETSHVKSEMRKRERLHRMSEVWVFFYKTGVCVFQSQKPAMGGGIGSSGVEAYYGSLEYKNGNDAIKGSRACGVLLSGISAYVVYNTREQRMKWAKKMERSMRVWTEKLLLRSGSFKGADALILGESPSFLIDLLESDGGVKKNLFQVDDVYDRYYYVPMCEEASVQIALLCDTDKRRRLYRFLEGVLSRKKDKEFSVCDGYNADGNPVYFCLELEMHKLSRIKQDAGWKQEGTVFCLDYQEETLQNYFGEGMKIQAILTKRLCEYLRQDA